MIYYHHQEGKGGNADGKEKEGAEPQRESGADESRRKADSQCSSTADSDCSLEVTKRGTKVPPNPFFFILP